MYDLHTYTYVAPATKDDSQIPGLHECLHTYMYVAPATKDDSQIPGLHEYLPKSGVSRVQYTCTRNNINISTVSGSGGLPFAHFLPSAWIHV